MIKSKKGVIVSLIVVGGTVFAIDNAKDAEQIENLQNQIVDVPKHFADLTRSYSISLDKLDAEFEK